MRMEKRKKRSVPKNYIPSSLIIRPSAPLSLTPHENNPSFFVIARLCKAPAATSTTLDEPRSFMGYGFFRSLDFSPSPNWPKSPLPQTKKVPASVDVVCRLLRGVLSVVRERFAALQLVKALSLSRVRRFLLLCIIDVRRMKKI